MDLKFFREKLREREREKKNLKRRESERGFCYMLKTCINYTFKFIENYNRMRKTCVTFLFLSLSLKFREIFLDKKGFFCKPNKARIF